MREDAHLVAIDADAEKKGRGKPCEVPFISLGDQDQAPHAVGIINQKKTIQRLFRRKVNSMPVEARCKFQTPNVTQPG